VCGGDNTMCGFGVVVPPTRVGVAWFVAIAVMLIILVPVVVFCALYQRRRR